MTVMSTVRHLNKERSNLPRIETSVSDTVTAINTTTPFNQKNKHAIHKQRRQLREMSKIPKPTGRNYIIIYQN